MTAFSLEFIVLRHYIHIATGYLFGGKNGR